MHLFQHCLVGNGARDVDQEGLVEVLTSTRLPWQSGLPSRKTDDRLMVVYATLSVAVCPSRC
jgi:hypothetical protein